jgi:hypothetical protein
VERTILGDKDIAWRKQFGGMTVAEAQRLKELEKENARLKRLLAERDLGSSSSEIGCKPRHHRMSLTFPLDRFWGACQLWLADARKKLSRFSACRVSHPRQLAHRRLKAMIRAERQANP